MTEEKIIDKLRKLKAHADSAGKIGNEEEAHAFATMLQKLLAKHNIGMSDVEWEQQKQEEASTEDWNNGRRVPFGEWACILATIIAKANNCRVLNYGNTRMQFIGSKLPVEVCAQTLDYMYRAARKFAKAAQKDKETQLKEAGYPLYMLKNYRGSYLLGFVHRLSERYEEEAQRIKAEASTSIALMRLSESLRLADAYLAKIKTRTNTSRRRVGNSAAYADGRRKADEVNINGQKISNTSSERLQLN